MKTLFKLGFTAMIAFSLAAPAGAVTPQQDLINRADVTLKAMRSDPDYTELNDLMAHAKAIMVVPQLLKAAFFFGGEGGDGVMMARLDDGGWSPPAFYVIGSASFGIQFGAKSSEVVFVIMTEKGLDSILNSNVKLGADVSVALVTVGKGLGAGTGISRDADIYAIAKSDGLFGGAAFDGSIISARDEWDQDYYGRALTAREILVKGKAVAPEGADALESDLK
jgi:lipid-binding SYLF domain-containing protein